MKQLQPDNAAPPIAWHTAFLEAIQIELEDYRDVLEFQAEHPLTSEPLRIDCVIIKKKKDVVIKKNIAAMFRDWNILEYKSPTDYVSVSDFYKVYGYACLYASFEKVPITGLTISFVESRYPEKLIEHLEKERGYQVEETGAGIYTVKGDILPIQVIDSRKLPGEDNLWLKGLSNRIDPLALLKIDAAVKQRGKEARIRAYLYAIAQANPGSVREAIGMSDSALTLEQVFEEVGWTAKWQAKGRTEGRAEGMVKGRAEGKLEGMAKGKAEGRTEGRTEGKLEIAKALIAKGFSPEEIVEITQLDTGQIAALYQQQ